MVVFLRDNNLYLSKETQSSKKITEHFERLERWPRLGLKPTSVIYHFRGQTLSATIRAAPTRIASTPTLVSFRLILQATDNSK